MVDAEIEGMNIDINMGANIQMEELKIVLEQLIQTFKTIAQGTKSNIDSAVNGIKEGGRDLINSSKIASKHIKESMSDASAMFEKTFKDSSALLTNPIRTLKNMMTSGLKDAGSSFSEGLGSMFETGATAAIGGGTGMAGVGAIGGGATAASGGTLLPLIIAIGAIAVAISALTKIVEMGFAMLGNLFSSFFAPIEKTLGMITKIISGPLTLLGSVFAEMFVPYLQIASQIARVFYPLIIKFREDYYKIYEKLTEEGAGPLEAAMGASGGALAGFMFDLFKPLLLALSQLSFTIQYTIIGHILNGIETFANVLIEGLNPIITWFGGTAIEKVNLLGGSIEEFVENGVKKSMEDVQEAADTLREFIVDIVTNTGAGQGIIFDSIVIDENTAAMKENTEALIDKTMMEKENMEEDEKYSKLIEEDKTFPPLPPIPPGTQYEPEEKIKPIKPSLPFSEDKFSLWMRELMGSPSIFDVGKESTDLPSKKEIEMKGTVKFEGSEEFFSEIDSTLNDALKTHISSLESETKKGFGTSDYSLNRFNI